MTILDRFHVWFWGGARIRVRQTDGGFEGTCLGRCGPLASDRLESVVRQLQPDREGIIDVYRDTLRRTRVMVSGPLAEGDFTQQVRNLIANL